MAGRQQAQFTRYASMNPSYSNVGAANGGGGNPHGSGPTTLGVPLPTPNSGQQNLSASSVPPSGAPYNNTTPTMTSPYSASSSPGYHHHQHHHSPNFQKYGAHHSNNLQLRKYTLRPPPRQQLLSKSMDSLGYPGLYPQRPNQVEDIMTESNVRNGFIDKPAVENEHTCAHDMVYSKLQDDQRILGELGAFAVDVLKRKQNAARITGHSSFRPPMRSTLIESKKEQWMQELASTTKPLRNLARNVPHGFKGEKLLDTLAAKQVPFLRATWYIKVVGLSEMNQRNANMHSFSWTSTVTSYLTRQLKELASAHASASSAVTAGRGYKIYPSTPSNHHDNLSKPWSSAENRARFEQRWAYSTQLTKWQYCEGLLDQRSFLKWSLDTLKSCHSFEIMWLVLTFVVQDYLDEYRRNRTLMKLLIETLIKAYNALTQFSSQMANDSLAWVYSEIKTHIERLLQSLFLSTPDIFVVPKLYHQYRHLFDAIFGDESRKEASVALPDVCHVMQQYWAMVKARNEVFCGTPEENQLRSDSNDSKAMLAMDTSSDTTDDTARQGQMAEDQVIRILDGIGRNIDSGTGLMIDESGWMDQRGQTAVTASHAIFGSTKGATESVQQRVSIMCRWATSDSRHGDWRPYLVASILLHWRDQSIASRRSTLQDVLIKWLDTEIDAGQDPDMDMDGANDLAAKQAHEEPKPAVILLFDTLIRMQLFSYQRFLLRLIARGDLEPKKRDQPRTRCCLNYLAAFPLTPAPASLVYQRRVALYGIRNGQAGKGEDETLLQLKHLAKQAVAASAEGANVDSLFGQDAANLTEPTTDDSIQSYQLSLSNTLELEMAPVLRNATRYTVLNFTTEWLVPQVQRFVVKSVPIGEDNWRVMTSPGSCLLNARQYVTILKILEYAQDYLSIVDLALWVLEKSNERVLYSFAVDTLRKHASIWKLLNYGQRIADAIWEKHQNLQSQGVRERCLMMYMIQLVQEGYWINDEKRGQLQQDLHFKPKARAQYTGRGLFSLSNELSQVVSSPTMPSVQGAVEAVCGHNASTGAAAANWLQSTFAHAFEALHQHAKEHHVTSLDMAAPDQRTTMFEFRRRLCAMVDFIKAVADQTTLTGQLDEAVVQWLLQYCSPTSATKLDDLYEQHTWLPLFLALLVTRRLVSIDLVLKHFALPWLHMIGLEAQQRCESQWTETTVETQPLRQLCRNIVVLVRMLVVQERPEAAAAAATTEEQDTGSNPWVLRAEEIFQLQVQRQPQLATNLEKLDNMFGLVHSTISIVSNLPFSSLLIQDLIRLRSDLLQLDWFRRACTRDVNSIYQHFAATPVPGSGGTVSNGAAATDGGEIRKKMLSIVDELIGGSMSLESEAAESMVLSDMEPNFGDRLQAVFANLSQWNEEQCRVQLNLLLDNIMLPSPSPSAAAAPASVSAGEPAAGARPGSAAADPATSSVVPGNAMAIDSSPAPTASIDANKELDLFVKFYFDAVLFSANDNEQAPSVTTNTHQRRFEFLRNLIQGLRKPVLLALLDHGIRMLEGHGAEELGFPYTILLRSNTSSPHEQDTPCFYSRARYAQQCQAFFQIMQHLLAKDVWSDSQKISLIKALFRQVEQFRNAMAVYKVMESTDHVSFAEASRAIQLTKSLDLAVAMLKTDGLPEGEVQNATPRVMLEDIRLSLLLRLRLLVPFASLIWEHPKSDECDILEWIRVLVPLLGNPIVHGNGSQERMFEFVLDLVSLLIDELPTQDLRKLNLNHLSSMHGELSGVPAMFHCRVKRILPFLAHNIYLSNTRLASSLLGAPHTTDPQQQQQHVEACMEQSKPWEWLEDYTSEQPHDNDAPISLALFRGCKAKKTESTYVRWYHFGFDDGLATIADEDNDSTAIHVGMVGHRVAGRRRKTPHHTAATNCIPDASGSSPTHHTQDHDQTQPPPAKRRISEMEDGELP